MQQSNAEAQPVPDSLEESLEPSPAPQPDPVLFFMLGFVQSLDPEPQLNVSRIQCYSSRFGPPADLVLQSPGPTFVGVCISDDSSDTAAAVSTNSEEQVLEADALSDRRDSAFSAAAASSPHAQPATHDDSDLSQQQQMAGQAAVAVGRRGTNALLNEALPAEYDRNRASVLKEGDDAMHNNDWPDRMAMQLNTVYTMDNCTGKVRPPVLPFDCSGG